MVEPIAAVPLNDELQEARALVAKAELDVLSKLTDKVLTKVNLVLQFSVLLCLLSYFFYLQILLELESIQSLLQETIKLDKVLLLYFAYSVSIK
jgi:hypothetical protein